MRVVKRFDDLQLDQKDSIDDQVRELLADHRTRPETAFCYLRASACIC
jgi:hypothetical protein